MARPCWSQRTDKWPGLGSVYDGKVGEADLRSVSEAQEVWERGTGVCHDQTRLQGGGRQELF